MIGCACMSAGLQSSQQRRSQAPLGKRESRCQTIKPLARASSTTAAQVRFIDHCMCMSAALQSSQQRCSQGLLGKLRAGVRPPGPVRASSSTAAQVIDRCFEHLCQHRCSAANKGTATRSWIRMSRAQQLHSWGLVYNSTTGEAHGRDDVFNWRMLHLRVAVSCTVSACSCAAADEWLLAHGFCIRMTSRCCSG